MRNTPNVRNDVSDGELVMDALWGSPDAIAGIYDRYRDEIYDVCWLYLRDREEAGEVAHATFVAAVERLWRLREPRELRGWLREVARHQVDAHRRPADPPAADDSPDEAEAADDTPDGAEAADAPPDLEQHLVLRALLWDDAYGLINRDRRALSLHLGEGLEGPELARAIGVRPERCDALLTRLRDRVDHTLGALVVARLARSECERLDALMDDWDGAVLARGRIGSHVGACDDCRARRDAIDPWSLLSAVPVVFAPAELRDAVLPAMVAVAAKPADVPPSNEPSSDDVTAEQEPVPTVRHRMLRRGAGRTAPTHAADTRAAIVSGTARTVIAVLVVAGMTGSAALGFSDAAWVTAVRHEARELGDALAGDGAAPADREPAEPDAPPVAGGPGAAPDGSDTATTGGGSSSGGAARLGDPSTAPSPDAESDRDGATTLAGRPGRPKGSVAFVPLPLAIVPEADAPREPGAQNGAARDRVAAADGALPPVPFVGADAPPAILDPLLPDEDAAGQSDGAAGTTPADPDADDANTTPSTPRDPAAAALADAGDLAREVTEQAERAVPAAPAANAAPAAAAAPADDEAADEAEPAADAEPADEAEADQAPAASTGDVSADEPETSTIRTVINALLSSLRSEPAEADDEVPAEPAPAPDAAEAGPVDPPAASAPDPRAVQEPADDAPEAQPEPAPPVAPAPVDDGRASDEDTRRRSDDADRSNDESRESRRDYEIDRFGDRWDRDDDDRWDRDDDDRWDRDDRSRRFDGRDGDRFRRSDDRDGDGRDGGYSFFSRMMDWGR